MKRKLLTQMRNEWRSNIWLTVELIIVSVVLWAIFMFFSWLTYLSCRDKGHSTDDIIVAEMKYIPERSESYQRAGRTYLDDMQLLEQRIKQSPYVMYVGRGNNALPYNYNYHGISLQTIGEDTTYQYYGNQREMTADAVRALELRGRHGETAEQLITMLKRGELLLSDAEYKMWDIENFVGKEVIPPYDSSMVRRVGAEIYPIARSDFETTWGGTIVALIDDNTWAQQMIIKVKPGMGRQFMEAMNADEMRLGNVFLSNLRPIERDRDSAYVDVYRTIKANTVCAIFLMTVIFMGFLGSFWFRIQQRVPEIALRIVNGATRDDIFRRLLAEGFMILIPATVVAVAIEVFICKNELVVTNFFDINRLSPFWGIAETFVALSLMVFAGICIPARKAMNINPAEALKDE